MALLSRAESVIEFSSCGYRRLWVIMCPRDLIQHELEERLPDTSRATCGEQAVYHKKFMRTSIVHPVKPSKITCPTLGEEHLKGLQTY